MHRDWIKSMPNSGILYWEFSELINYATVCKRNMICVFCRMSTSGDAGKLGVRHAPQTVSFQGTRSHFSYNPWSESESFLVLFWFCPALMRG